MSSKHLMTLAGKKRLEKELNYLKEVKAKEINEEIKKHHAFCDFSENASFDQMLDEQALVKERIHEIQDQLALSELVSLEERDEDTVQLGDRVTFINRESGEEESYQILGRHEAEITENKISIESPIGQSFLGREINEEWTIEIPAGEIEVKLINIK